MTNAIIINIMDIQRIQTSNIAIMPIIQRFYAINFVEFFLAIEHNYRNPYS